MRNVFLLAAYSLLVCSVTFAEDTFDHYNVEKPKSVPQAWEMFDERMAVATEILQNSPPTPSDIERIHEITYGLEAAIESLMENASPESLSKLAESVEELHVASEQQNQEKVRSSFREVVKLAGLQRLQSTSW